MYVHDMYECMLYVCCMYVCTRYVMYVTTTMVEVRKLCFYFYVHCASQFTLVVARSINNLQIFFRTIERQ